MIGTKLVHYEITAHLGSGGMGDVYQATDSTLGRCVAIKLLPEAFASDSDRVVRFEREARVLASLNDPKIAAIYGLESSGGRMFLVMEFVPGETLAERIHKGPIPLEEALGIAKQIAEALEAAHREGVVHRDLKPANVKITPDGRVKVLDFGLAKAYQRETAGAADLANSPTLMSAASIPGIILGTAAYMSPEQAKGKTVDSRTDIFAFGCVLYEMLASKRVFGGEDVSEILANVLAREPDWTKLPADLPQEVRRLLRLCLEKNASSRKQTAADLRVDIEQALKEPSAGDPTTARESGGKIGLVAAAIFALAFLAMATVHFTAKAPEAPEMRLEITTPSSAAPSEFAYGPIHRTARQDSSCYGIRDDQATTKDIL